MKEYPGYHFKVKQLEFFAHSAPYRDAVTMRSNNGYFALLEGDLAG